MVRGDRVLPVVVRYAGERGELRRAGGARENAPDPKEMVPKEPKKRGGTKGWDIIIIIITITITTIIIIIIKDRTLR